MAFDKDSSAPILQPHKKTTKVNIAMALGVVVFFIICAAIVWWTRRDPPQTPDEVIPPAESK